MSRPVLTEYEPYWDRYISKVPDGSDIVDLLENQGQGTQKILAALDEERGNYRYAPEKWSVKQVIGHLTDGERIFGYRMLAIARGEKQSLPGFEEKDYVANANF